MSGGTAPRAAKRRMNPVHWLGIAIVSVIFACGILSFFWTPYALNDMIGGRLEPPGPAHWAGTDRLGRDLFTQLMIGARIALVVGAGAVAIGAVIGVTTGMLAAFATRFLDDALAAVFDILIAFPTLLIAMLVVAAREQASLGTAILALGIGVSPIVGRVTRILTKRILSQDYITAARVSGTGWPAIALWHIMPNIAPFLGVTLALQFGLAVMAEASLSYLGLGAPPPNASWGRMLQEAQGTVYAAPWGAILPGLALFALVIGVNLVADGLRDRFDPTGRAG
ncbi:ABC transporter permease [Celeribacter indicus]|uniref:Binding-protein-dependent transport system inner membrane protein n=1 Tax=Celeribacter indicus TaxID=1208324 RepID=A0A0B5DQL4_9RHOB|nr:ABC transporter permease [Celeribacter indicus]AJE45818.1 binding-protein-dependent transport system inner membrane protein [Celeribacter indicus]SDW61409.1 peptide/nickel transport system permease protein [Celeribacter indicus]